MRLFKKTRKKITKSETFIKLTSKCAAKLMRFCFVTTKWETIGLEHVDSYVMSNRGLLMALWHDRLMTAPCAWKWIKPLHVLASEHNDGRLIAKTVENLNMIPVYGSTGKCSVKSIREMIDLCNSGQCLAIIPDGPRGPRHVVSDGIVTISKMTKTDIIPFSCCVKNFKKCKSWDEFIIAYPFNKGVIICGEPIKYNDIKDIDIETVKTMIKEEINKLSQIAYEKLQEL